MSEPRPTSAEQREDVRRAAAAALVRRERVASLTIGERIERLHRLCRQLAGLAEHSPRRP